MFLDSCARSVTPADFWSIGMITCSFGLPEALSILQCLLTTIVNGGTKRSAGRRAQTLHEYICKGISISADRASTAGEALSVVFAWP